ncbi:hypothetical protein Cni_G16602 [Canna indica]|uniref:Pentatricopeptide repeat-containing protein n=1 Tax=Canna indica TaxID=4628 RepID=A0AAQ3KIY7_9LILI|nr:hypothetical protein Cni_G16602 [Canna indica]
MWRRCLSQSFHFAKKTSFWVGNDPIRYSSSSTPRFLSTNSRYILVLPLIHNGLLNNMIIGCELSTLSAITHSIAIQVSVQEENVVKALEHFINAKKDDTISVKEICTSFMAKLCRSNNLSDAAYLLRHLQSRGISLCLNTYNIVMTAAVASSNFNIVSEVFKSLLISGLPPDITSYTKVAEAIDKVANSDLVNFIKDVSEITMDTDCTVINRILFMTAKLGQVDKSLMIFEVLKNLKLKMDTVTFNAIFAILGKASRINEMMSEFVVMKDRGHIPDIVTYSTLINCLRRHGRLDLCKTIANEMLEKGIQMDLLTYTALVDLFGRAGHVEAALRIFEEMKKFHHPSVYTYRSIISNLKRVGKFELAVHLSSEMNSNIIKLAGPEDFKQKGKSRGKIKKVG